MSPARMDRAEVGLRIAIQYAEAFSRRDVLALSALITDDCVWQDHAPAPDGTTCSGKAAVVRAWQEHFAARPQAHLQVEEVFGMGLRCVLRWKNEAGRKGLDVYQVRGGLIAQILSYVKG